MEITKLLDIKDRSTYASLRLLECLSYIVRKDDIRKALNKEYLDTIKRIAMKWED
jgi:hypothetical protein